jgi:hypothetical protein
VPRAGREVVVRGPNWKDESNGRSTRVQRLNRLIANNWRSKFALPLVTSLAITLAVAFGVYLLVRAIGWVIGGPCSPMLNPGRPFDLPAYVEKLSPDLGYAILTATIVEEQLEMLLLAHLQLDDDGVAAWFGNYKNNSFAGKIREAHERGLIDDEPHCDLAVIKDIRNAFAHTRERLDFKAPQRKALAERFGGHTKDVDVRRLFDERVSRVVTAIQAKMDRITYDEATAGK